MGQRSSIGEDDFGRTGGKLLAIQDAAIRVIEPGGIDARAAFAFTGKRHFNTASHSLRPRTCSNFGVCQASLPARSPHADLVGSGLRFVGSSHRLEGESPMRVRKRSFEYSPATPKRPLLPPPGCTYSLLRRRATLKPPPSVLVLPSSQLRYTMSTNRNRPMSVSSWQVRTNKSVGRMLSRGQASNVRFSRVDSSSMRRPRERALR